MDYAKAFAISGAGMDLERTRLEIAALNLANANVSSPSAKSLFQPLVVTAEQPLGANPLDAQPTAAIKASNVSPRRVHQPGHPHAGKDGFVLYPNIDPLNEMLTVSTATRAYEANLRAMNAAKAMALRALEIGENR